MTAVGQSMLVANGVAVVVGSCSLAALYVRSAWRSAKDRREVWHP